MNVSARKIPVLISTLLAGLAVPQAAGDEPLRDPVFRGALSCSAAACHGGLAVPVPGRGADMGARGGEYHVWAQHDPHARAYQALFQDVSAKMIERLARNAADRPGTPAAEHYRDAWRRCLACHSLSRDAPAADVEIGPDGIARVEVASPFQEGVGCEACHGRASEPWFREHSRGGWADRDPAERKRMGFVETSNLLTRAKLCAECHVGSAGREVNHDLLALGHPVLRFELAGYSELLPKHWDDDRERQAVAWFEWRLWAAGQVRASRAALEVLRERARRIGGPLASSVWPEFSEYSCESCHHALPQAWRPGRGFRIPGVAGWSAVVPESGRIVPPWSLWFHAVQPELAAAPLPAADADAAAVGEAIERIRGLMEGGLLPDRDAVVHPTDDTIVRVDRWLARPDVERWLNVSTAGVPSVGDAAGADEINRITAGRIAEALGADNHELFASWERATQIYLMIAAWERSLRDELRYRPRGAMDGHVEQLAQRDSLRANLRRLRELLASPPGAADTAGRADGSSGGIDDSVPSQVTDLLKYSLTEMRRISDVGAR